ncbi:phage major tail protein, TP901-1 family [Bacillus sp. OTU530]|uniref:phage major tail protein, TP901-1 family n=1 Tax=Bacillus sp. OTU530 TaxID=3043862 RepID=UPI00313DC6D9
MARGVNFLIYVNTGTTETPVWTKVAGQRGGTFNRDVETIDTTSKDSTWSELDYGFASWSIEGDGLLVENDVAFVELEDAFMSKTIVKVRFETAAGAKYEGNALITSLPIEAPYDDAATYSITLTGTGAPTKTAA